MSPWGLKSDNALTVGHHISWISAKQLTGFGCHFHAVVNNLAQRPLSNTHCWALINQTSSTQVALYTAKVPKSRTLTHIRSKSTQHLGLSCHLNSCLFNVSQGFQGGSGVECALCGVWPCCLGSTVAPTSASPLPLPKGFEDWNCHAPEGLLTSSLNFAHVTYTHGRHVSTRPCPGRVPWSSLETPHGWSSSQHKHHEQMQFFRDAHEVSSWSFFMGFLQHIAACCSMLQNAGSPRRCLKEMGPTRRGFLGAWDAKIPLSITKHQQASTSINKHQMEKMKNVWLWPCMLWCDKSREETNPIWFEITLRILQLHTLKSPEWHQGSIFRAKAEVRAMRITSLSSAPACKLSMPGDTQVLGASAPFLETTYPTYASFCASINVIPACPSMRRV